MDLNIVILESGSKESSKSFSDLFSCKSNLDNYTGIADGRYLV